MGGIFRGAIVQGVNVQIPLGSNWVTIKKKIKKIFVTYQVAQNTQCCLGEKRGKFQDSKELIMFSQISQKIGRARS